MVSLWGPLAWKLKRVYLIKSCRHFLQFHYIVETAQIKLISIKKLPVPPSFFPIAFHMSCFSDVFVVFVCFVIKYIVIFYFKNHGFCSVHFLRTVWRTSFYLWNWYNGSSWWLIDCKKAARFSGKKIALGAIKAVNRANLCSHSIWTVPLQVSKLFLDEKTRSLPRSVKSDLNWQYCALQPVSEKTILVI